MMNMIMGVVLIIIIMNMIMVNKMVNKGTIDDELGDYEHDHLCMIIQNES